MRNIKLTISYDGTNYRGWQLQKNGPTVQAEIEKAVKKVFRKDCRVHGAGRTDAGVHAKAQVAHFKTSIGIGIENIPAALNAVLPEDVAVVRAEEVTQDFHSRFDARSKHYRYYILNTRRREPFRERYSWRLGYALDVPLMKKESGALLGRHDFKSFQASDNRERSSVRTISRIDLKKGKPFLTMDIEADGFLYNMVRNIVGTLVDVGRGHLDPGSTSRILKNRDRTTAGPTAPAKGLFLIKVKY